jgi:dephospho-CoA kinase
MNVLKIGLTGGIGSGKSLIGKIVENLGYPVYYSDLAAKELVDTDSEIRSQLIGLLGSEVYIVNELNRPFLAQQLFKNDQLRIQVNQIIHPKVRSAFEEWCNRQNSPYVFNEAAILFETGAYKTMDKNLLVTAPTELRIQRVIERDKMAVQQVEERISKQWSDNEKRALADFIIINDEKEPLIAQIETFLATL